MFLEKRRMNSTLNRLHLTEQSTLKQSGKRELKAQAKPPFCPKGVILTVTGIGLPKGSQLLRSTRTGFPRFQFSLSALHQAAM